MNCKMLIAGLLGLHLFCQTAVAVSVQNDGDDADAQSADRNTDGGNQPDSTRRNLFGPRPQSANMYVNPDLRARVQEDGATVTVYAYRISDLAVQRYECFEQNFTAWNCLYWHAFGAPKIVPRTEIREVNRTQVVAKKLMLTSEEGFAVQVELVSLFQIQQLALAASSKYYVRIKPFQIETLPMRHLECFLEKYDPNGAKAVFKGVVENFNEKPLNIRFPMPVGSTQRSTLEKIAESWNSIVSDRPGAGDETNALRCNAYTSRNSMDTKELKVSAKQLHDLVLKLLDGENSSLFVTKLQFSLFASQAYNQMSIAENYRISEFEFQEALLAEFHERKIISIIKDYPISALKMLSNYSLHNCDSDFKDFEGWCDRKDIISDLSAIFTVARNGSIVINQTTITRLRDENKLSHSDTASNEANYLGVINLGRSLSLSELSINSLNSPTSHSSVKWSLIKGDVIPTRIALSRVNIPNITYTVKFSRINRPQYDALVQSFSLRYRKTSNNIDSTIVNVLPDSLKLAEETSKALNASANIGQTLYALSSSTRSILQEVVNFNSTLQEMVSLKGRLVNDSLSFYTRIADYCISKGRFSLDYFPASLMACAAACTARVDCAFFTFSYGMCELRHAVSGWAYQNTRSSDTRCSIYHKSCSSPSVSTHAADSKSFYYYMGEAGNQNYALNLCRSRGMHLPEIRSNSERTALGSVLQSFSSGTYVWLNTHPSYSTSASLHLYRDDTYALNNYISQVSPNGQYSNSVSYSYCAQVGTMSNGYWYWYAYDCFNAYYIACQCSYLSRF